MTSPLGLNEGHQANVVNYIRFARYQRSLLLRTVKGCFKDTRDERLADETTFTIDEVEDIIERMETSILTEVESEVINTSHTTVLLMRQVFQQAEKWHLKLQADVAELENKELLDKIRAFEEQEFDGVKDSDLKGMQILAPLNETSASDLLKMEIQRLQDEITTLSTRLTQSERQVSSLSAERMNLISEVDRLSGPGSGLRLIVGDSGNGGDSAALAAQMARLKTELDASRGQSRSNDDDLTGTKHDLLKVRAMLELAEKELEKKVSQTAPYRNLKQMMQKKNDQLKEMRRKLAKYEEIE